MSDGSTDGERFSDSYRRYALGLLFVVYVFNFIDRQILSILIQPIKEELALSDTQLGFLSGIAFALFYSTLGIPIARLADRGSRNTIIAVSLAVWSAMTAASGLARSFTQLAIARIGVGVGEAGCSPPAHSLISDLYPPERRATALSIYAMGIPVGVLFGYLIGGWMNEFFGWRAAFFVVGLPGVGLALVVRLSLREPRRRWATTRTTQDAPPSFGEAARLVAGLKSFRHIAMAAALHAFVGYGVGAWVPAFLARSHGMSTGEIGSWLALLAGLGGGTGTFLGGWLCDRLAPGDKRWYVWVPAISTIAAIPFSLFFYLWDDPQTALIVNILPSLLGSMYLGPTFAMTQGLVPSRMRAVASAILLFIINLIGLGLGPQAVGIVSDLLSTRYGAESLRHALTLVVLLNVWSAVHYLFASRHLRDELGRHED